MFAAVVIPAEDESVEVLALDAVDRLSLAASGVLVDTPVTASIVQRQVVVLLNDRVMVWLPVLGVVPRNTPVVRVPSLALWIVVHVAPAPLIDGLPPPDDTANAINNVSPDPIVRVVLPEVVALISRLAGVLAKTGRPISYPASMGQFPADCQTRRTQSPQHRTR